MEDLVLVELIETEVERLSPEGREAWSEMERAAELNGPGSPEFLAELPSILRKAGDLPAGDARTIKRLIGLYRERKTANALGEALGRSEGPDDLEESRADDAGWFVREWRRRAVVDAARRKDLQEGRSVDLDRTAADALRRLVEDP